MFAGHIRPAQTVSNCRFSQVGDSPGMSIPVRDSRPLAFDWLSAHAGRDPFTDPLIMRLTEHMIHAILGSAAEGGTDEQR